MLRFPGRILRVALLIPLLAGARVDCGASDTGTLPVATSSGATEADCHHETDSSNQHHQDVPQGGHCPAYHSCALDCSLGTRLIESEAPSLRSVPVAGKLAVFASRSQLPEVPPPRS